LTAPSQYSKVDILVNNAADANDGYRYINAKRNRLYFCHKRQRNALDLKEFVKRRGSYGRIINFLTDAAQAFPRVQITY
ncbi:MAG: hypothetical protein LBF68_07550, partial [Christensenellaceae bacterium]|nr:hypothetical protein [Christensenellaceae bacterium]